MSKKRRKKNKAKKIRTNLNQTNRFEDRAPLQIQDDGDEVIILARREKAEKDDKDSGDAIGSGEKAGEHSGSTPDSEGIAAEEECETEEESQAEEDRIEDYDADDYENEEYDPDYYEAADDGAIDYEIIEHETTEYEIDDQPEKEIEEKTETVKRRKRAGFSRTVRDIVKNTAGCIRRFRLKVKRPRPENIAQYFFVIRELTAREIKRKYARSSLGIIWSVLNPLLTMVVMSLIFSTMFRRSIENFPIYLLTGQIFWTLFSTATNSSMSSLVDNKSLLVKAKLPKQTFILSRIYTALVNFLYTCVAYILMILIFRIRPGWTMLLFPVDVLFVLAFSTGIGYMLSVAYVFWADIKYFYGIFLTLLMYMSALFYPVSNLSESMQKVVEMNPVYLIIAFARSCVMYGEVPERYVWIRLIIWCGVSIGGGLFVFKKKENDVMQRI